jgi:hypothetical protein
VQLKDGMQARLRLPFAPLSQPKLSRLSHVCSARKCRKTFLADHVSLHKKIDQHKN